MAMKKADMKAHQTTYKTLMRRMRSAEKKGDYQKALKQAWSSWKHLDGMMQYERKYEEREFSSVESIETVLKYAPLVFDLKSLSALEALLSSQRRIEKNTSHDLADKLADAMELMWAAHRVWDHLERHSEVRQDRLRRVLGGGQKRWRSVALWWEKMGLVRRTPDGDSYRLSLCTRLSDAVLAKCASCGVVARAAKAKFLGELTCPKCTTRVVFVIQSRMPGARTKE